MKDAKFLLIVNPAAGKGKTAGLFDFIKPMFETRKVSFEYRFTSGRGDAEAFARDSLSGGFTHIIAVGGDGTSHDVVNGILRSSLVFGIIPSGSGNDFPKSAGIPLEPSHAVNTIFSGLERSVDVGKLGDIYFINGLGIGLDGAVSHRFKNLKRFRGQLGYVLGAVQEAFLFKGFKSEIIIGDWEYSGTLLLTGASNGVYQGGKFKLAPGAKVDDGLLDFHIIKDMPPLERLIKIPKVLAGTHSGLAEVELRPGTSMEIKISRPVPAHMDGEPFYLDPGTHRIDVVPGALRIMSAEGV
ncbi:MAG: diacylglycerol/lipid kinase family protein [Thermodesulfobacteriota bacterium]